MCNCVELVLKLVKRCLTPSILSAAGQMRRTLTRISPLRSVVLVDEGKTGSNAEMKYSLVRLVKIPTPGVVVFRWHRLYNKKKNVSSMWMKKERKSICLTTRLPVPVSLLPKPNQAVTLAFCFTRIICFEVHTMCRPAPRNSWREELTQPASQIHLPACLAFIMLFHAAATELHFSQKAQRLWVFW